MTRIAAVLIALLFMSVVACTNGAAALHFSPDELPPTTANDPYSMTIQVTGNNTPVGGVSISNGELPDGLAVDVAGANSGAISSVLIHGTPTTSGTYTFTISVWCYGTNVSGQTGEKEYTLVVS